MLFPRIRFHSAEPGKNVLGTNQLAHPSPAGLLQLRRLKTGLAPRPGVPLHGGTTDTANNARFAGRLPLIQLRPGTPGTEFFSWDMDFLIILKSLVF